MVDGGLPAPPPPAPAASLQLTLKHAGVRLKVTLDAKWQAKSVQGSCVVPFVKSFNKKRPDDAVADDRLLGVLADDVSWLDASQPVSVLPAGTAELELFFGSKAQLAPRSCRISFADVVLKIEIEPKWLRKSFLQAVVHPFVLAYNKKLVPTPLHLDAFAGAQIDGDALSIKEAARPAGLVLPIGVKDVDLAFDGAEDGTAATARPTVAEDPRVEAARQAERLKHLWQRVNSSAEKLAQMPTVRWSNHRLGPADGATVGAALRAAALIGCEGSFGDGLGNLLTLNLECNDLRDEGVAALAPALHRDVMVTLRDLYLMENRIDDRGVASLTQCA